MVGFGSFERTLDTLEAHLDGREWTCGERFTMADVYVGSQVDWGLTFGTIPPRPAFAAYAERLQAREAYKEAKAIDHALIQEMKK
jgi:glutathione S-transferase